MSTSSYQVVVASSREGKIPDVIHRVPADRTQPVRIKAQPGATYTLVDKATEKAPQQVHAQRRGKHLILQLDEFRPGDAPDVVLENFYEGAPSVLAGVAEDQETYRYIPDTAKEAHQVASLADGAIISQVLGGSPMATVAETSAAAPLAPVAGPSMGLMGATGGLLLAGGAALGGGGGGSKPPPTAVPLTAALDPDDDSGTKGDGLTRITQPRLKGTTAPGNKVFIRAGDSMKETEVAVDDQGHWSWKPTEPLVTEGKHAYTVRAVDPAGRSSEGQTIEFTLDIGTPEAVLFGGQEIALWDNTRDVPFVWTPTSKDIQSITASFLGQAPVSVPLSGGFSFAKGREGAGGLADVGSGFYTLSVVLTDAAGNAKTYQQVVRIGPSTYTAEDAWQTTEGANQLGSSGPDLFINRAGNQTFEGRESTDTYVWLARDAAKAGSPDVDTIRDFTVGSTAAIDKLDLRDLLGRGHENKASELDKYLRITHEGSATKLWVSTSGQFGAAAEPAVADLRSVSNQVIVLEGVSGMTRDTLLTKHLVWENYGNLILG